MIDKIHIDKYNLEQKLEEAPFKKGSIIELEDEETSELFLKKMEDSGEDPLQFLIKLFEKEKIDK